MEGRIEQRECRPLTRAVERAIERRAAPFDIRKRQCPERTRNFRHAKVAKVSRLECSKPVVKQRGVFDCHD
jgi:hypothetical protein